MLSKSTTPQNKQNTSFFPFDCCFMNSTQDDQLFVDDGLQNLVSQSWINQNQKNLRKSSEIRRVSLKTSKFSTIKQIPPSNRHSVQYLPKQNIIFASEQRMRPLPSMVKPLQPLRVSFDHMINPNTDFIRQSNKSLFSSKGNNLKIIEQPQIKIFPTINEQSLTNSMVRVSFDDKMFKSSCEMDQKVKDQYIRKRTFTMEHKDLDFDKLSQPKSRLDQLNCKKTQSVKDEEDQLHISQTINLRKNTSSCMEFQLLEGLAKRTHNNS